VWGTPRYGQTFVLRADFVMNTIAVCLVGVQFLLTLAGAYTRPLFGST